MKQPLLSGSFGADFKKGLDAYEGQDFAAALEEWKPHAERGNALAQVLLGNMYKKGEGVPLDYAEAMKWYHLAAEQGNALAQALLGYTYKKGDGVPQDHGEAMKWYLLAAEQGLAIAQFNLGMMYAGRLGFPEDPVSSYMWWNLAAAQGHKDAAKWRDEVAKVMAAAQITEAQKLSTEWMAKHQESGRKSTAIGMSDHIRIVGSTFAASVMAMSA